MDTLTKSLIKRIVAKYEDLIAELDAIDKENRAFLDNATKNKNVSLADVDARMKIAKENLNRLRLAKAERDALNENYLNV